MEDEDEPLDALDLPQVYERPSASALLSTLSDLSLAPPSWDTAGPAPNRRKRRINNTGIPAYLTKIVSSSLQWIESDEEKETIWEAASQRLSERSGRAGMSAMTRSFRIPLRQHTDAAQNEELDIILHEPAMTADNLGLKTWASSYLLAKRLSHFRDSIQSLPPHASILELGSGTGLVGLAAAAVFGRHVVLTDLPDIVPNLEKNIEMNMASIAAASNGAGGASATVLDWSEPASFSPSQVSNPSRNSFTVILAADPIYSPSHPAWLVKTIAYHLSRDRAARLIIELPLREYYAAEREELKDRLTGLGLGLLKEGQDVGYDDWVGGDGEGLAEVTCWWGVWRWE